MLGILVFLAARPIASVFTTDPAVADAGAAFLRYSVPTFGFIGVMRAYTGRFRGTGKTFIAAVISVVTLGVVRLPVAWTGANALGSVDFWLSFAVSNVVGGVIAYLWFKRGAWRETDLADRNGHVESPASATDD